MVYLDNILKLQYNFSFFILPAIITILSYLRFCQFAYKNKKIKIN